MEGDYEKVDFLYGNPLQLISTAFVARKGYPFMVSDFSSIEARVLAYRARENGTLISLQEMMISTPSSQPK